MNTQWQFHIREKITQLREELNSIREDLHRHPELSFQEHRTSSKIKEVLDRYQIAYTGNWVDTGVVATIGTGEPCVALRADIDALPITELNNVPYASQNPGVMHACGHDVHTTCLLGAAMVLKSMEQDLPGSFRLIFQPGEEKLPGGARQMIEAGVLTDPVPALIIGQHVHPPLSTGEFGFRGGQYMASADELYIDVYSEGGHAALPQDTPDSILCASAIIQNLQQIISRKTNPHIPAVLTIGDIHSEGGATNIIPPHVHMKGTLRCMDEPTRHRIWEDIRLVSTSTAQMHGCRVEVDIKEGYPYLHNDETWTQALRSFAEQWQGKAQVHTLDQRMTAEDFAYYGHQIPGVFYRLGVSHPDAEKRYAVHHPRFDVDPEAIIEGSQMMAFLALRAMVSLSEEGRD